jgi:hypothetical protein
VHCACVCVCVCVCVVGLCGAGWRLLRRGGVRRKMKSKEMQKTEKKRGRCRSVFSRNGRAKRTSKSKMLQRLFWSCMPPAALGNFLQLAVALRGLPRNSTFAIRHCCLCHAPQLKLDSLSINSERYLPIYTAVIINGPKRRQKSLALSLSCSRCYQPVPTRHLRARTRAGSDDLAPATKSNSAS